MWGSDPVIYIQSDTMANYALEQIRGYMHKRWTKDREAPGSNGAKVREWLASWQSARTPLQRYYSEIKGPDGRYCQQAVCTTRSLSRIHPMCMSSILAVHPNRKLLSSRFEGLKSLAPPLGVMVREKFAAAGFQTCWVATFPSFPKLPDNGAWHRLSRFPRSASLVLC